MMVEVRGETVVGEIEIAASPEAVFDAWTNPADLAAWWGSEETYRTFNWQVDLRPGGKWSCQAKPVAGGEPGSVHGEYLIIERPTRLAYTWNPSWDDGHPTEVDITFERTAAGTLVRFVHSGFGDRDKSRDGHSQGWTRVLGWLQKYSEKAKEIRS